MYQVILTSAFNKLVAGYERNHKKLGEDLEWLKGRLNIAPERLGTPVPQLQKLTYPIYKTRCKDSCCNIGASGGWRIYYAIDQANSKVFLLFLHHKREYETATINFLVQTLEKAFESKP